VVVVDVVTERLANLHEELMQLLSPREVAWSSPGDLYAVAYRIGGEAARLEVWTKSLMVGEPLPTMPLWIEADLAVPLNLEESYLATCASLRIAD
jgi:hypothetical protein